MKNIAVKNLPTPADIVNCAVVDCSPSSTATVGSAYDADALASGATLALLQQEAGSDPSFAQMDLSDLYAALDAAGVAADTTTLADIYAALDADGLAADTTTLADLYGAIDPSDDTTTLGQLIDDLAANDPSDLTGVFLGDLVAGLIPESSYPWQDVNLDTPGLAQASTGGGELTLTADFDGLWSGRADRLQLHPAGRLLLRAGKR